MALWGMVIDLDRCTGCQACVMACKAENNVPAVGANEAKRGRVLSWMQVLTEKDEEHPNEKMRFIPRPCLQCDDPPCTKVCPVYATYRNPEGIVAQIYARCIGCRFCMAACPYNANISTGIPTKKKRPAKTLTFPCARKASSRSALFATTACKRRGSGRWRKNGDFDPTEYVPACAEACPAKAIVFGDLADPASEVAQLARSPRAFKLLEELGTKPKVIYLTEGEGGG